MDRQIIYPGQIPLETDLLNASRFAMTGLAKLAAAMLGTSTIVSGLACVPTGPASLQVLVNPGEMYSLVALDATAYSSLAADTTHNILKQGMSLDAVILTCAAPATAGQSVNYLIQAAYQDSDAGLVTLPYYNASNPTQAWSGPNNTGAQQATARKGIVLISAKVGTAATTGTQTTPAPDAGYTGLWVVTVANGQTTITSANIVQAANAPFLPTDLLHAMQQSGTTIGVDTGAANVYAVSYNPGITALTDGMVLWFKVKTANTGASTLNINALGASPIIGFAQGPLQGGELSAQGRAQVVWRADISSFVLIGCTGGALQVGSASQSNHAVSMGFGDARFAALSQAFGIAQTMQNLTGSRALSTTYTNSTGKPIFVSISITTSGTSASTAKITVGGVDVPGSSQANTAATGACAIVPPGATYVGGINGTGTLSFWNELR
jgi:hypothetical protein